LTDRFPVSQSARPCSQLAALATNLIVAVLRSTKTRRRRAPIPPRCPTRIRPSVRRGFDYAHVEPALAASAAACGSMLVAAAAGSSGNFFTRTFDAFRCRAAWA